MRTCLFLFFCTFNLSLFSQTRESLDYEKYPESNPYYNTALIDEIPVIKDNTISDFFSCPATGILTLFFEEKMCPTNVCIYDASGKCVHNEALQKKSELEIDLRQQPKGMYVMELSFGNEKAVTKINRQ